MNIFKFNPEVFYISKSGLGRFDPLSLYFIHSQRDGRNYGGNWFFKGITGYVV